MGNLLDRLDQDGIRYAFRQTETRYEADKFHGPFYRLVIGSILKPGIQKIQGHRRGLVLLLATSGLSWLLFNNNPTASPSTPNPVPSPPPSSAENTPPPQIQISSLMPRLKEFCANHGPDMLYPDTDRIEAKRLLAEAESLFGLTIPNTTDQSDMAHCIRQLKAICKIGHL